MKKYHSLHERINIIQLSRNVGYAEGNNIGVQQASGEYILFQNTDTVLDKNAILHMVKAMENKPFVAGVAPKIYLSKFLPLKIFDSIGICMNSSASPYNRGIGQVDLGQYDFVEEVMGLCFATALVRKDIFLTTGGLDSSYFAYFEDVDWSFRVRKHGYKFFSCPKAIVTHYHSGTSSENSYAWKYNLIFRNYLRTVVKTFGKRNVLVILGRKTKDLLKSILDTKNTNSLRGAMLSVLIRFYTIDIFVYLLKRIQTRQYFISEIVDESIIHLSDCEPSNFFDPKTYKPLISLQMLEFIILKKNYCIENKIMLTEWSKLKESYYCSQYSDEWNTRFHTFITKRLNSQLDDKVFHLFVQRLHQLS
jgi:GT2 family glycosyltransferase